MSRSLHRILVAVAGLSVAGLAIGCVPAEQYAALKLTSDKNAEQLAHAQSDANAERARADALQSQVNSTNNAGEAQIGLVKSAQEQADDLRKQNQEIQDKYNKAIATIGQMGTSVLPAPLTSELTDFAAKYPDVITFDAARGTVKFKSDVTFPSGDANLTAAAKPVLQRFAQILTAPGTGRYDLLVAGNTDSTPVISEATKKHGNFDNWYLSAHRAIAVGEELITSGVPAKRIGMVGYADERPIPGATAAQNRRVEVVILPSASRHDGGGATAATVARRPRPSESETSAAVDVSSAPPRGAMGKEAGGTPTPPPSQPPMLNK